MALGCGTIRVFVQERGGRGIIAELPYESCTFGYRLDETTDAQVTLGPAQLQSPTTTFNACQAALRDLNPWQHEISIWRNDEPVWVGPITEPLSFSRERVTIGARDLSIWYERRVLTQDYDFFFEDLSVIWQAFHDDAMSQDPSPNIEVDVKESGILATRQIDSTEFRRVADEMRELQRTGLDVITINRRIIVRGPEAGFQLLPTILDDMISEPELTIRGLSTANTVTVLGSGSDRVGSISIPFFGEATDVESESRFGRLHLVFNEPSIEDDDSAEISAKNRLELVKAPPKFLTATLNADAGVQFKQLIPGTRVPVQANIGFKPLNEVFVLNQVQVEASNGTEQSVQIELVPIGRLEVT